MAPQWKTLSQEELREIVLIIDWGTVRDKDDLLVDLLVRAYPTRLSQNN